MSTMFVPVVLLLVVTSASSYSRSHVRRRSDLDSSPYLQPDGFLPQQQAPEENVENVQSTGSNPAPVDEIPHLPGLPYNYSYQVKQNRTQFSQKVISDGETVNGEYRVLLPDGRVQVVSYMADWKNGYRAKVTYVQPAEIENEIKAGGSGPLGPCRVGYSRRQGETKCRPDDESETDIQPGGQLPTRKPIVIRCPEKDYVSPTSTRCVAVEEREQDIQPGGRHKDYYYPTAKPPCRNGHSAPSTCRVDESEKDIQPGGYFPATTPPPCPAGFMRYPAPGGVASRCHPVFGVSTQPTRQTRAPVQIVQKVEPQRVLDTGERTCPYGYVPNAYGECQRLSPTPKLTAQEKCLLEGKDPNVCYSSQCFPGSTDPKCVRPSAPREDENEEDIQSAGATLPRITKVTGQLSQVQDREACLQRAKDPRVCYAELCYPGSTHRRCQQNIQGPGERAPTQGQKPSNLYDTPDTPFGVRLHKKFGY